VGEGTDATDWHYERQIGAQLMDRQLRCRGSMLSRSLENRRCGSVSLLIHLAPRDFSHAVILLVAEEAGGPGMLVQKTVKTDFCHPRFPSNLIYDSNSSSVCFL